VDGKRSGLVPSNFVERVNEGTKLIVALYYNAPSCTVIAVDVGELTRKRQKFSLRRGMLQHIDEEEENDPNSEKSITSNQSNKSVVFYVGGSKGIS